MFAGKLARGIRTERLGEEVFALGKLDGLAVGAAGRGEDEPMDSRLSRGLQEVQRGRRPAGVRLEGLANRARDARDRGFVEHKSHALDGALADVVIGEVPLDPIVTALQVGQV